MALASLFSVKETCQVSIEGVRRALQKQRFGDKEFLATNQGIGIIIDCEKASGHKYVRRIVAGSPAAECGNIRLGDRVLEINGQEVHSMPLKEVGVLVSECDKVVSMIISRKMDDDTSPQEQTAARKQTLIKASSASTVVSADAAADIFAAANKKPPSPSAKSATSAGSSPLSLTPPAGAGVLGGEPRLRSDSEASDDVTVSMDSERLSADGRVEFSVLLEKGKVIDDGEELLQKALYTKGHLSFIKGRVMTNRVSFDSRWIAVRHGRLIVTKGRACVITKTIDLAQCTITNLLQSAPGSASTEFFVGVKYPGRATMYFGDKNRENVERLLLAIKGPTQCESSTVELKSSPAGFCSARIPVSSSSKVSEYVHLLEDPHSSFSSA